MSSTSRFSERHSFVLPSAQEINVRNDAPHELRGVVIDIAYEVGLEPPELRAIVCRTLRTREDPNNWTPWPNIAGEVQGLVDSCEWFQVYDIIESIYSYLARRGNYALDPDEPRSRQFAEELNKYFQQKGIGWQLADGQILVRGPEAFEEAVSKAVSACEESNRGTALKEIHEALRDMSRRPDPDKTGAIQHAMAALECVARDVAGDPKATLGECLRKHPDLLPAPLDQSIEKAWGFASERARHLREGRDPNAEEAELIVGLCSVVVSYLIKRTSP